MAEHPQKQPEQAREPEEEKVPERSTRKLLTLTVLCAFALFFFLYTTHMFLGACIAKLYDDYDFLDGPCEWAGRNLPLWFVGNGLLLRNKEYWITDRGQEAVPFIKGLLRSSAPGVKEGGLELLRMMDVHGRDAGPAVVAILVNEDETSDLRLNAAMTLATIGYYSPDAIPAILSLASSAHDRYTLAWRIGETALVDDEDDDD